MTAITFDHVIVVASAALVLAAAGALVRVLRGPYTLDRVVALDVLAAIVVALTVTAALRSRQAVLIDVGLAIALVSFVATIALAHFMEERGHDDR
jgi:multicomponent Na+:H+ antiporter subunit F